jgi:hypothetical protein
MACAKRHALDECGVEHENERESARGRLKRTSVDICYVHSCALLLAFSTLV